MIEIIEVIWQHSATPTSIPDNDKRWWGGRRRKISRGTTEGGGTSGRSWRRTRTHDDDDDDDDDVSSALSTSTPNVITTLDVGGTSFPLVKTISVGDADADNDDILLVAGGKSHLSYLSVGVLSSVLYLDPDHATMSAMDDDDDEDDDDQTMLLSTGSALALEMHYHLPARAVDLRRATNRLIEANLPKSYRGRRISELPRELRRGVTDFVELYQDVKPGDRSTLSYHPRRGLTLGLNGVSIGTIAGRRWRERERRELARILYGVWFGSDAPFSASMRDELLTPLRLGTRHGSHATGVRSTSGGGWTYTAPSLTTTFATLAILALSLLWNRRRSSSSSCAISSSRPVHRPSSSSSAIETSSDDENADYVQGRNDDDHRSIVRHPRSTNAGTRSRGGGGDWSNIKSYKESWVVLYRLYPKSYYCRIGNDYYPDLVEVDSDVLTSKQ